MADKPVRHHPPVGVGNRPPVAAMDSTMQDTNSTQSDTLIPTKLDSTIQDAARVSSCGRRRVKVLPWFVDTPSRPEAPSPASLVSPSCLKKCYLSCRQERSSSFSVSHKWQAVIQGSAQIQEKLYPGPTEADDRIWVIDKKGKITGTVQRSDIQPQPGPRPLWSQPTHLQTLTLHPLLKFTMSKSVPGLWSPRAELHPRFAKILVARNGNATCMDFVVTKPATFKCTVTIFRAKRRRNESDRTEVEVRNGAGVRMRDIYAAYEKHGASQGIQGPESFGIKVDIRFELPVGPSLAGVMIAGVLLDDYTFRKKLEEYREKVLDDRKLPPRIKNDGQERSEPTPDGPVFSCVEEMLLSQIMVAMKGGMRR